MNLMRIRAELLLLIIGAYVILNHGFMLLRVPPSGGIGVPIGELIVLLFALTFIFEIRRLPSFAWVAPILPLAIWWGVGGVRAALGLETYGIWALRDATHFIDSLFLWIGFVAAATPGFLARFSGWLRALLNVGVIYTLLYPFREALTALSPKISAPAGYQASLLFNYSSGGLLALTAATRWLVDRTSILGIPAIVLAGGLIVFCVVLLQMRTVYVQIAALLLMFFFIQPRTAVRLSFSMMLGVVLLFLVLATGIEISGRLGETFSINFLFEHIAAIWGQSGSGATHSAASGLDQRFRWWALIWEDVTASFSTTFFGLGYGIPLTDFRTVGGIAVREPHNSLMSIIGRLGFVGLFAFIWFHLSFAATWFTVHSWCRKNGAHLWKNNMIIMGAFFVLLWVFSMAEDGFEKPFNAIPYYFLWGVILRVRYEIMIAERRGDPVPSFLVIHRNETPSRPGQTRPSPIQS